MSLADRDRVSALLLALVLDVLVPGPYREPAGSRP